jgi:hypothetical protein
MQIIEFSDLGAEPGSNALSESKLVELVKRISSSDLTLLFGIPFENAPVLFQLQSRGDNTTHDIGYYLHSDTRVYTIIATKKGGLYHA